MHASHTALLYALFNFCVALLFFVMSIRLKAPGSKVLAFWYAVAFECAGYLSLAAYTVTSDVRGR